MDITEDEYLAAKKLIKKYKVQEFKKTNDKIPIIEEKLKEFFKNTYIKDFYIEQEDKNTLNIKSLNPEFDEDYNGEFDKDMNKFSEVFEVDINFEPFNYSK